MLRIGKTTRLKPVEIIDKASVYFGIRGEGLDEVERGSCCISFEGTGGYLTVSVVEEGRLRAVDVETREFEYQAKQFLRSM